MSRPEKEREKSHRAKRKKIYSILIFLFSSSLLLLVEEITFLISFDPQYFSRRFLYIRNRYLFGWLTGLFKKKTAKRRSAHTKRNRNRACTLRRKKNLMMTMATITTKYNITVDIHFWLSEFKWKTEQIEKSISIYPSREGEHIESDKNGVEQQSGRATNQSNSDCGENEKKSNNFSYSFSKNRFYSIFNKSPNCYCANNVAIDNATHKCFCFRSFCCWCHIFESSDDYDDHHIQFFVHHLPSSQVQKERSMNCVHLHEIFTWGKSVFIFFSPFSLEHNLKFAEWKRIHKLFPIRIECVCLKAKKWAKKCSPFESIGN